MGLKCVKEGVSCGVATLQDRRTEHPIMHHASLLVRANLASILYYQVVGSYIPMLPPGFR